MMDIHSEEVKVNRLLMLDEMKTAGQWGWGEVCFPSNEKIRVFIIQTF
jgi:hypothetical protein